MRATDWARFLRRVIELALVLVAVCATSFAQDSTQQYTQTNVVSNQMGIATTQDTNLVNAWGLSRSSGSPWWISDYGTGLSTLYTGAGVIETKVVTIPSGNPSINPLGTPTGTIYNGSSVDFLLAPGKAASFLFATYDGTISGWNNGVNPTTAVIEVNQSGISAFTGLAVAQVNNGATSTTQLYVADFQQGRVQIYDTTFNPVAGSGFPCRRVNPLITSSRLDPASCGSFYDDSIPEGYAPFNIWNIGGNLYVTYAAQNGGSGGFVDVFSPSGTLLHRLEPGPWFNAPWGLALASSDFGLYSHDVLVGQFGSGQILAFDPVTGSYKGTLLNASNQPITIDGLWALSFGTGGTAGAANALYFTSGPNGGSNGLFGTITPVQNIEGNDQ